MKLEKLVLTVGKKTLELTPTEAKELKAILSDLFGERETRYVPYPQIVREIVDRRPYWHSNWTLSAPNARDRVYCSNTQDNLNPTL